MQALPDGVPLFRQQVVERRANVLYGATLLPPPRWHAWLAWLSAGLVAGVLLLLATARYTPHVTASGRLVHHPGDATVTSPRAGTVARILAADGVPVAAGAPLLEIESRRDSGGGTNIDRQVRDALEQEAAHLAHQVAQEQALLATELAAVHADLQLARGHRDRLAGLRDAAARKLALTRAAADRLEALGRRGLVARTQVDNAQLDVLSAQMTLGDAEHRLGQELAAHLAREARLRSLPVLAEQRIAALQRQEAALRLRLAEADGQERLVLRAPIAGRVTRLLATAGQSVGAGSELLTLVPQDARLRGELLLSTRAGGFVEPGMPVRVRYPAFPFRQYGQQTGTVAARDLAAGTVSSDGEAAYRIMVEFEGPMRDSAGTELPLKAGMALQAELRQRPRRLLDWLLDPLGQLAPA